MLIKGINEGFTDQDLKQGIVSGYFAMFGNKDLDGDIIEKGAFAKTIQERGPKGKQLIKMLLDHDRYKAVAKITLLEEDSKGLRYEAKIGTHSLGIDFMKMVESDLINQHSFGFIPIKEMYDSQMKANRIKEVMMHEGSALQFLGANPETTMIDLKSAIDAMEYLDRLEKFIKTTDCTDETIITLELRLKSLSELLKPVTATLNEEKAELDTKSIIEQLKKTFKENGRITT
jgi:HK97 family phage prohead protease